MIEITGVNKSFDHFQALTDLDLHVKKGSIYGLVGTNGAGKTTIIKHITGVLKPDSGDILMDGQPVYENISINKAVHRRMIYKGYVIKSMLCSVYSCYF